MTTSNLEGWHYVKIVLVSLADGTSTKTVNLSNRPIIEEADGSTVYYPILKAIENVGGEMGDYIPSPHNGSIVIDDSPHAFGFERRFSDLLQRYSIFNASIKIYSAETTIDDIAIGADFSLDWTTTGISWERSGDEIRIAVAEESLNDKIIVKAIDLVDFPNAPSAAVGKFLPLAFGNNVTLKCINISDTSAPIYGISTAMVGSTVNFYSKIGTVKAKDIDGIYQSLSIPATTTTALFSQGSTSGTYDLSGGAIAFPLYGSASASGRILQGGKLSVHGNSISGSPTGSLKISIVRSQVVNSAEHPATDRVICSGTIDKANYAANWNAVGGDFFVPFSFDRVGVIKASTMHWVIVEGGNEQAGTASKTLLNINAGSYYNWSKGTNDQTFKPTTSQLDYYGEFYGLTMVDYQSTQDANGLAAAGITIAQQSAPSYQTNPSLSNLDLVVVTDGIYDINNVLGDGAIVIRSPDKLIRALDYRYNGTTWTTTGSQIDVSRFSTELSNHCETSATSTALTYARQISGQTEGRVTVAQVMADICRNAALKICRYNGATKPFTLYAWGTIQTSDATITDDDCKILGSRQLGPETVVNRVTMQYGRDITLTDLQTSLQEGGIPGYQYNKTFDITTDGTFATCSTGSVALYGRKELATSTFNLISSNLTNFALSIAYYYARVYPHPFVTVDVEVPLYKYRSLDMLDVITLISPKLPSYFGTSANALLPYYSGASVDVSLGFPYKRADAYRAQIEGKVLNYNLGDFPTMRLSCRLLLNYPNDPT